MTQREYVLTAAAEADVHEIIRYTRQQWGNTQVRRYITKLEQDIARLASGKGPYKDMSALYPTLRLVHCEHHIRVLSAPRERTRVDRGGFPRGHGFDGAACRLAERNRLAQRWLAKLASLFTTSAVFSEFQQGGQRLSARWSTIISALR